MSKLVLSRSFVLNRLLGLNRSPTNWRAALGYLLVALIAYGATAAATHSHGRVLPDRSGVTVISDAGESPTQTGHSRHRECSMCQFQRQLFGGLVLAPLFSRTPLTETAFVSSLTVFYPSTSTTAPSGRAPPPVTA